MGLREEKRDMSSNCGLKYETMWIGRYYFKDKSEHYFDEWYNANCAKCKYMRDNVCWQGASGE